MSTYEPHPDLNHTMPVHVEDDSPCDDPATMAGDDDDTCGHGHHRVWTTED